MTILDLLIQHEGANKDAHGRHVLYQDTVGKWTIGYGRNLTDNPLTENEAKYLLENDLGRVREQLDHFFPWWRSLDDVRQMVLIDMTYNMGIARLCSFSLFLSHLKAGEYDRAATEMLNSVWAMQVGKRATTLAAMMRTASVQA